MADDKSSNGWCVQLTGQNTDLEAWSHELANPFDPWIEKATHVGQDVYLLRSTAFVTAMGGAEAQALGRSLLDRLQGAFQITSGQKAEVALGASVFVNSIGVLRFHHFLEADPVVIRVRVGTPTLTVRDATGAVIPPPPPSQSAAQRWVDVTAGNDTGGELLIYLGRADNWFDLFKAFEVVRKIAGGEDALSKTSGVSAKEIKDLKRTANYYRHAGGHHTLPKSPPTIGEARSRLNQLARAILDEMTQQRAPKSGGDLAT